VRLQIFDVSHGFCAYLMANNGNVMLFDCGWNDETGFRPSNHLLRTGCNVIEHLIIQNFDQDHVGDLPNILAKIPVRVFYRNRSLTPSVLRSIKESSGPLTEAMQSAIDLHATYVLPVAEPPIFPNIDFGLFFNSYPLFKDTNNLSLVVFIVYDGLGIVFPGDLETAGWKELLKDDSFRAYLAKTTIFIASHHGRTTGYCADVFRYCRPEIIIVSDKEKVYDTQEQDYSKHASGILWNGGPEKRYVLSTRADGMITITKEVGTACEIAI